MSNNTRDNSCFGPGKTVAVIGAGISGVCTAAHLLKQGLSVTVFERSGATGGIWHYDPRVPEDPPYPNNTPSFGDYEVSQRGEHAYATPPPESPSGKSVIDSSSPPHIQSSKNGPDLEVHFSPPGPCYAGLKNNVPTTLMVSSLHAWPENSGEFVGQSTVETYIQDLAKEHGVTAATLFHTRVDEARKTADGSKWEIRSVSLEKGESGGGVVKLVERFSHFDLLVVASGHYNMPRIPDIPGLKEWKAAFPSRVIHSKQYRNPEAYRNQNVVILGAGVSSLDICRELGDISNKTYQSVRGGPYDLPASLLPRNATRVPEIARFILDDNNDNTNNTTDDINDGPIPGTILLTSGDDTLLPTPLSPPSSSIHQVIVATGYVTSYPFLPHLHADDTPAAQASDSVLVTAEGDMVHNLHKDIFYIPDPSLAFVGVPYHVSTFSLFDFQAQAVARVFGRTAGTTLPSRQEMRAEYEKRVAEKGLGRGFHSLHEEWREVDNSEDKMVGHSEEWLGRYEKLKRDMKELLAGNKGWDVVIVSTIRH
ncbi:hypothetical protein QBC43DRAFT_362465 [Cladorrhinum sp. PSN259]|nr:hypothetical protein QBC43DRAFT_362465 [Cladorrhinum sp. PSN259]